MMVKLIDAQASVYAEPDQTSDVMATLAHGEVLQIAGRPASGADGWVTVALPDGRHGYLPTGTRVERLPVVELDQDATIRAEPSEGAAALITHGVGARLHVLGATTGDGRTWLAVANADGHRGFIPRETRLVSTSVRPNAQAVRASTARAKRDMVVGGLWCVGGLAVTIYTYTAAAGGGTYVVAWGAIIFGGWQFLRGLSRYMSSREP